ncbi:hypothetical protein V1478_010898 [Vespula squamosa]|uniref:Uncharacterized protein n=1 Tax=Vespula squamosa TaxID=30214 RepID=A0ABD2AGA3_VESSQ
MFLVLVGTDDEEEEEDGKILLVLAAPISSYYRPVGKIYWQNAKYHRFNDRLKVIGLESEEA